jgi:DNA recombination protein RmuC
MVKMHKEFYLRTSAFYAMEIVFVLTGIGVGFALGFLAAKYFGRSGASPGIDDDMKRLMTELESLRLEKAKADERIRLAENAWKSDQQKLDEERARLLRLTDEFAASRKENENLADRLREHKAEVEELQERFKTEFKNIANELLEDKSRRFTEQNQEKLGEILKPLNERIRSFEEKVDTTHKESLERNAGLVQQIRSLSDMNRQMSEEAKNLTKALKGDSKAQGNWGEVILERVLEKSGLRKNEEYFMQDSVTNEDGKRLQPDVVIKLPDNKNIVVDSKVSLVDYERFCAAETEEERTGHLKAHIRSVRSHVKGLSEKNYHQLYGSGSPDFVLLFVPIEPSFSLAVQHDSELFNEAFDKNIVIVSTSTLLATLRTIASIWRQENQTRNAVEIARQAGDMYDKFEGFVADMLQVGRELISAKKEYDAAMNKLTEGKGNLVNRAQKLKDLGAKASKSLPQALIERAADE